MLSFIPVVVVFVIGMTALQLIDMIMLYCTCSHYSDLDTLRPYWDRFLDLNLLLVCLT